MKIVSMKNKVLLTVLIFIFALGATMAQPKIEFEKTVHDFGDIVEGSIARHDFVFTNIGNQPLVIASVRASCGCTTPTWTQEPVMPGQKGTISVGYYSEGRPGSFNRSITVMSNAETQYLQIFIRGEVKKEVATISDAEKLKNSPLIVLEQPVLSVGKVEKGQRIPINITVGNNGKNDLMISGVRSSCNCIAWTRNASPIKNGRTQVLQLIYSPATTGEVREEVVIYSNDLTNSEIKFQVVANIVESIEPHSIMKQNNILKF
jgi:hypothetical protein